MKKGTRKVIEVTPEWVLMNLSDYWFTDGKGLAIISTTKSSSRAWVELALDTLDIEWDVEEIFYDEENNFQYVFDIEDVIEECPEFYKELIEDNNDV